MGGNINLNINQITSSGTCINLPTGSTANLNAYIGELLNNFTGTGVTGPIISQAAGHIHSFQYHVCHWASYGITHGRYNGGSMTLIGSSIVNAANQSNRY